MGNPETTDADRKTLYLNMEVSGCVSACAHCWAQGHPYPPMGADDIERVLEEGARFCGVEGLRFHPFPMHEVLMHPDALKLIRLFYSYAGVKLKLGTSGHALAQRADWEEILNGLKELGTTTLWFAFHGLDDVHDRVANHKGAFRDTITTIERAKSIGLWCGTNLFLTSASAHQIPDILQFFRNVGIDEFSAEVARYNPHPRGRAYEALRPELDQLLPHAQSMAEATGWHKDFWSNLEQHTEAYYINAALTKQEPELTWFQPNPNRINVFCRTNMDVHSGLGPSNGPCHGNLRTDDAHATFANALNAWPVSEQELVYPGVLIFSPLELARQWGDPQGSKVYMNELGLYVRLLDVALGGAQPIDGV